MTEGKLQTTPFEVSTSRRDAPIIAQGLDFSFGKGELRKQVLFDVNLRLSPGRLVVLMGASGSGKTTLLTLVGCLRRVEQGSVVLLGHELNGASESLLERSRRKLGFIFQAHNLHESLTALENVLMGLQVHGRAPDAAQDEAAAHVLGLVGLSDRIDYLPGNLSGGQKQRVAVARALVGNPDIVLADEPTAALDKHSGMQVVDMLKKLGEKRDTTTLMVTHDNRILDRADRIITLDEGRIIDDTTA